MAEGSSVVREGVRAVEGHSVVRVGSQLVMHAGRVGARGLTNATYVLSLGTLEWREARCRGYPPVPRSYHTASVYGGRMLVFGGMTSVGWDDVHFNNYNVFISPQLLDAAEQAKKGTDRFRMEGVTQITQAPLEPFCYHELDLVGELCWSTPATTGDVPQPRSHHSAAVSGGQLFVFGGYNTQSSGRYTDDRLKSLFDVFALDVATRVWSRIECVGTIPPLLWGQASVLLENVLFTFGGVDGDTREEQACICAWSAERGEWRWLMSAHEKSMGPRSQHTAVLHKRRVVLFGGASETGAKVTSAVHVFDLVTGAWVTPLCTGEAPSSRRNHTAVELNDCMYVTGGADADGDPGSRTYSLDLITWHWTALSATFNATAPIACLADDGKTSAVRKLQKFHKKRRLDRAKLLAAAPGCVTREVTITRRVPADRRASGQSEFSDGGEAGAAGGGEEAAEHWGIYTMEDAGEDGGVCLRVEGIGENSPADGVVPAGARLVKVNGALGKDAAAVEEVLDDQNLDTLTILIEQPAADAPPTPPGSDGESDGGSAAAEEGGGEAAPASLAKRHAPVSDPTRYTQTPELPMMTRPAAMLGGGDRILGDLSNRFPGSPRKGAADRLQAFGHNVFTASAAQTGMVPGAVASGAEPNEAKWKPRVSLGKYGFVDVVGGGGNKLLTAVARRGREEPADDAAKPADATLARRLISPTRNEVAEGIPYPAEVQNFAREGSACEQSQVSTQAPVRQPQSAPAYHTPQHAGDPGAAQPAQPRSMPVQTPYRDPPHPMEPHPASLHTPTGPVAQLGPVRPWEVFPSPPVKSMTNERRTRYLSPSVVRLGMVSQLAINRPEELRGPFNGSLAASHPYGRSMAPDQYGLGAAGSYGMPVTPHSPDTSGELYYEGPKNFVTTTNTAIPAGLGAISSAAFLTGMRNVGINQAGAHVEWHSDAQTLLSRMPVDIRNAAAAAYKDVWQNWTWDDRLEAVKRYAESQARRAPVQRSRNVGDASLPVLPPASEGAEGWDNTPAYAAPPVYRYAYDSP
ncbi:Ras guanine nucleotide exchange factor F [Diplonema papillatum]|nr:Ras guanine nucleotide exchange factor F [Diplonema papillatum]